jgi:hypothetical protein
MKRIYFSLFAVLASMMAFAQEASGKLDVNINTDEGSSWLTSPWVWVAGAAIFILLLVALSSGGSRRSSNTTVERTTTSGAGGQTTTTQTVRRDEDDLV